MQPFWFKLCQPENWELLYVPQVFPLHVNNIQTQCVKVHRECLKREISESLNYKHDFELWKICHIFHLCPISCLLLLVSISNVEREQKVPLPVDHFSVIAAIWQSGYIHIDIYISILIIIPWTQGILRKFKLKKIILNCEIFRGRIIFHLCSISFLVSISNGSKRFQFQYITSVLAAIWQSG